MKNWAWMAFHVFMTALLLLGGAGAANAQAAPAITLTCCRCAHGDKASYSLNTGTGPASHGAAWTVSPTADSTSEVLPVNATQPAWQSPDSAWLPLLPAHWITPPASLHVVNGQTITVAGDMPKGRYVYRLRIRVPKCSVPSTIVISGKFGADNHARLLWDTTTLAESPNNLGYQLASVVNFSFSAILPGDHILKLEVDNTDDQSPTGMVLMGQLNSNCPPSPEIDGVAAGQGRG